MVTPVVRTVQTGLTAGHSESRKAELIGALFRSAPTGVGSTGTVRLNEQDTDKMLFGGAKWTGPADIGSPEDIR